MQSKKELINEYKNRKQVGGICKITNIKTNKIYVFTAPDIDSMKNRFEFSKKIGSCVSNKIQSDWNKYGSDSFTFEIIEELEKNIEKTAKEFAQELDELLEICMQKFSNVDMY